MHWAMKLLAVSREKIRVWGQGCVLVAWSVRSSCGALSWGV